MKVNPFPREEIARLLDISTIPVFGAQHGMIQYVFDTYRLLSELLQPYTIAFCERYYQDPEKFRDSILTENSLETLCNIQNPKHVLDTLFHPVAFDVPSKMLYMLLAYTNMFQKMNDFSTHLALNYPEWANRSYSLVICEEKNHEQGPYYYFFALERNIVSIFGYRITTLLDVDHLHCEIKIVGHMHTSELFHCLSNAVAFLNQDSFGTNSILSGNA